MKFLGENNLQTIAELVKEETDKKVDTVMLEPGKKGQFLISDGKGGVSFMTIGQAEGSKF